MLNLGKGLTEALADMFLWKKYTQLILQSIIRNFVQACIIIEQMVIYLLMIQKFINSKQKIPKLQQLDYGKI